VRSSLGDAVDVADGEVVGRLTLTLAGGQALSFDVRAGDETAEWMYDAPAVAGRVRHRKAPVASSTSRDGFQTHVYRASFELPAGDGIASGAETAVVEVAVTALRPGIRWNVERLVLHTPFDARFRLAHRAPALRIWENTAALPLAWWVPGYTLAADDGAALSLVERGAINPRTTAALTAAVPSLPPGSPASSSAGQSGSAAAGAALVRAAVVRRTANTLEVEVDAPAPGLLVVGQTAAGGWQAALDGQETALYTANAMMQAVYVPAGRRRLALRYLPGVVLAGGALSGLTGLALAGWAAVAWRRRRGGRVSAAMAGERPPGE
jgi:hypothetical protein